MSHRPDFRMVIVNEPAARACDICTEMCEPSEPRISTFVGVSGQSDVCWSCAQAIAILMYEKARAERDRETIPAKFLTETTPKPNRQARRHAVVH